MSIIKLGSPPGPAGAAWTGAVFERSRGGGTSQNVLCTPYGWSGCQQMRDGLAKYQVTNKCIAYVLSWMY